MAMTAGGANESLVLAVDLGGTKVAGALVHRSGEILCRLQEPTSRRGPEAGISQIINLVRSLLARADLVTADVLGLGIGIPAVLEPETDRVLWAPNLDGWRDVSLGPNLERELDMPAYVEYDGHTAVLGEWWQGAGRGFQSVVSLIVGTGIGGGIVLDGQLVRGQDRLAGAAGWFALTARPDLEEEHALSVGHWESLAAGPGIVRRAEAYLAQDPDSHLYASAREQSLTAECIFSAARAGDSLAKHIVHETAGILGLGVANIVSLLNPQAVILGGGVGAQGDLLLARVRQMVDRWAQPVSARSVTVVCSQLGVDAGLLGAAYAAFMRYEEARL